MLCARAITRATCSVLRGNTTTAGAMPPTAHARVRAPSSTPSGPTMSRHSIDVPRAFDRRGANPLAAGTHRQHLRGIGESARIEDTAHVTHQRHRDITENQFHVLALVVPDAMLS